MLDFKAEFLTQYFDTVEPKEFYRSIFPEGELQGKGEHIQGKYNAIAVELMAMTENGKNTKRYTITDDLNMIDELLKHDDFVLLSPISYAGRARKSENARFIYAVAIDLDGVRKKEHMIDLFYQMDGNGPSNHLPKPTYIVNSGNGLHLYYVLEKPIPCFKNIIDQLTKLKNNLTKKVWNGYVTDLSEKVQYQSIFQGFRLVGGVTKNGGRTKAYEIGERVSLEYLNQFVQEENRVTEFAYKSELTLDKAKEKYPDWYEKRIMRGEKKGRWTVKRDLYEWWKRKLQSEVIEGHRYYGMMCLAIYAKKCGLSLEELERDAFSLVEYLDKMTSEEDNHFTRLDVMSALEMFNDDYVTFPIKTISDLTGVYIQKNKRNYRKQNMHLKGARALQEIYNPDWRKGNGRPDKEQLVRQYIRENPTAKVTEIAKTLKVSRPTVYKYMRYREGEDQLLYPEIQVSNDPKADEKSIGKYGMMALNYLKENYLYRFNQLQIEGNLMPLMHQVNDEAYKKLEVLQEQMLKSNPIEDIKNTYQTYQYRNMIRTQAEDIVIREIVYQER